MKTTLQLNVGQQLTITPQLQYAIKLLQLSSLELELEIQNTLETNPLLETQDNTESISEVDQAPTEDQPLNSEQLPAELPIDTSWEDIYPDVPSLTEYNNTTHASHPDQDFKLNQQEDSLQEYLLWQMNLTPFSPKDQFIATAIIDSIADDGYLRTDPIALQETLATLWNPENPEDPLELEDVEATRHRIQQFDPLGIASLDLQDCLLVQLKQFPEVTPYLTEVTNLLENHLPLLANRHYEKIKQHLNVKDNALKEMVALLTQLNPKPGLLFSKNTTEYIIPDVIVKRESNRWVVELNKETTSHHIGINKHYVNLIKRADNSKDNQYLKDRYQEAKWFLKSLQNRNETLLKVATCIMLHQKQFLQKGEEAMKPMILQEIAEMTELHESTISRVTTHKYIDTPQGIYELKYFFSNSVGNQHIEQPHSATAIKAIIKKKIDAENSLHPLNDQEIANVLSQESNINIARRTVTKYRKLLGIPSSAQRKQLSIPIP